MKPASHYLATNPLSRFDLAERPRGLQSPLMQRTRDLRLELQSSQLRLKLLIEPVTPSLACRQAEPFQMLEPRPAQGRPGAAITEPPLNRSPLVRNLKEPPVKACESIRLRLPPYSSLGLGAGQVPKPLVSNLLSPSPESIGLKLS